jgi:hypothetical protein
VNDNPQATLRRPQQALLVLVRIFSARAKYHRFDNKDNILHEYKVINKFTQIFKVLGIYTHK